MFEGIVTLVGIAGVVWLTALAIEIRRMSERQWIRSEQYIQ